MIQEAITKNLAARGVKRVPAGGDVTVAYLVILGDNVSTRSINDYFGYSDDAWALHEKAQQAYTGTGNPNSFEAGTLLIDIIDNKGFKVRMRNYATRSAPPRPARGRPSRADPGRGGRRSRGRCASGRSSHAGRRRADRPRRASAGLGRFLLLPVGPPSVEIPPSQPSRQNTPTSPSPTVAITLEDGRVAERPLELRHVSRSSCRRCRRSGSAAA